jgi:hypothetical protein
LLRFLAVALVCAMSVYANETEESVRKSVPVSSATHLRLSTEFGSINLQPGTGKSVDVEVYFRGDPPSRREFDRMLHDFSLRVNQQGSEVSVDAVFLHGWEPFLSFLLDFPFSGHAICHDWRCLTYSSWLRETELRVAVPQTFSASVSTSGGGISITRLKGEVTAHTSGGWLRFDRIEGPINGSTSGGGITITGAKGKSVVRTSGGPIHVSDSDGDVDASTSGGPIAIDGVSGDVKARTSGGWIDARDIAGAIDASTSGGPVTASLRAQPQHECHLYTSGGNISLSLANHIHVNLDASSSGGWVSTDFDVPYQGDRRLHELRTPINGGGPVLYLHTSGGWINVHRAS